MAKSKKIKVLVTGNVQNEKGVLEKKVYPFDPKDAKRIVDAGAGKYLDFPDESSAEDEEVEEANDGAEA